MYLIENSDAAFYLAYILSLFSGEVNEGLAPKVSDFLDCDSKKDMMVSDLIKLARKEYKITKDLPNLMNVIQEQFTLFGLNSRVSFQAYSFFFELFITSYFEIDLLVISKEERISKVSEIVYRVNNLKDDYYKLNLALGLVREIALRPFMVDLSTEVASLCDYIKGYDLMDKNVIARLYNIFDFKD